MSGIITIKNIETLNDLIYSDVLKVLKKRQKVNSNVNYYFNPNLSVQLFNAKALIVNQKYIVLEFDKTTHLSLLLFLRAISDKLINFLKSKDCDLFDVSIYNIMSELENTFTIRCHLPNNKGKYFIESSMSGQKQEFRVPRAKCVIDVATIEIRNVWGQDKKYGFNVELKSVNFL